MHELCRPRLPEPSQETWRHWERKREKRERRRSKKKEKSQWETLPPPQNRPPMRGIPVTLETAAPMNTLRMRVSNLEIPQTQFHEWIKCLYFHRNSESCRIELSTKVTRFSELTGFLNYLKVRDYVLSYELWGLISWELSIPWIIYLLRASPWNL